MPDPVTHYIFGQRVVAQLPEDLRSALKMPVFERALQGPDPWSTIGFYGGKNKKYAGRSNLMHKRNVGTYLIAMTEQTQKTPEAPVLSVLAGAICHYCLDKAAHPYIIAKGGEFDGTEQTRIFSGGHVRLERAIDSYYIREAFHRKPWHFSIPDQILSLRKYPESLRLPLDAVYQKVYGWDESFDLINASLRDERWFYGLMQDPLGIVHYMLRPVSGGRTNYCIYSYYHRDIDSSQLDYLNLQHQPWQHPYDHELVSTTSFLELFDAATNEAVEMICGAYAWVGGEKTVLLKDLFGNSNYSTGFDCEDDRNLSKPVCEPLSYGGKYWNKGK